MEDERQSAEPDAVAEGIFFALFRVVEIAELKGAEEALAWADSATKDDELRRALADRVRERIASR